MGLTFLPVCNCYSCYLKNMSRRNNLIPHSNWLNIPYRPSFEIEQPLFQLPEIWPALKMNAGKVSLKFFKYQITFDYKILWFWSETFNGQAQSHFIKSVIKNVVIDKKQTWTMIMNIRLRAKRWHWSWTWLFIHLLHNYFNSSAFKFLLSISNLSRQCDIIITQQHFMSQSAESSRIQKFKTSFVGLGMIQINYNNRKIFNGPQM